MTRHKLPSAFGQCSGRPMRHTVREGMRPLSQGSEIEQRFVIAQLVRNKYALDYWYGALTNLPDIHTLWEYRGVRSKFRQIEKERTQYETALQALFVSGRCDPWEMIQDGAYEYNRELKRMVYFYEQAVTRLLQKAQFPLTSFFCKMSTAKSLLNLAAYIQGCECLVCPSLQPMLKVGSLVVQEPSMNKAEDITTKALPSVMGRFQRHCEQLNDLLLMAIDKHDGIEMHKTAEEERSMEIAGENIQRTFTDYDLMNVLMEETGHTLEEAKEIIAKRKAKYEEAQRLQEAETKRAIEREQLHETLKAAKAEHKKSQTK